MTISSRLLPYTLVRAAACRSPNRIALREYDRDGVLVREMPYEQLVQRMHQVARLVELTLGLARGENVLIAAGNRIEYLEIACGLSAAGYPVATANPRLAPPELAEIIHDCRARAVFADTNLITSLRSLVTTDECRFITLGPSYEDLLKKQSADAFADDRLADENDDFLIPYTSGTTGKPKGVVLSHRSRALTVHAMALEYGCFGPDDRFLAIAPLAHGAGFAMALAAVAFGGSCDLLHSFDPECVLRTLHSGVHTGVFFVPTHFSAMFSLDETILDNNRGHNLRTIISNAAALPHELKKQATEYFGTEILHECYGSTEASIVTNLRPVDQLAKRGSVGQPFANTRIRIVDENFIELPAGEIGELFSASPYLFTRYLGLPDATTAARQGEWVTSGDLAIRDHEGHVHIVGRKKDVIISGGINIYPAQIEDIIAGVPGIQEVAVAGMPHPHWGEEVVAFIVVNPKDSPSDEILIATCGRFLADFKRPRRFLRVNSLPRNAIGKIVRSELLNVI